MKGRHCAKIAVFVFMSFKSNERDRHQASALQTTMGQSCEGAVECPALVCSGGGSKTAFSGVLCGEYYRAALPFH